MSRFARNNAVYPFTPAADYSGDVGKLVNVANDTATLNASATVAAEGVILDADTTTGFVSVGILGAIPPVYLKAAGTIAKGAKVQQNADGRVVTDAGSGARVLVGIAMESAVANELFEVATFTPITLAA